MEVSGPGFESKLRIQDTATTYVIAVPMPDPNPLHPARERKHTTSEKMPGP